MGAITGALTQLTEFGGDIKCYMLTATVASASDTITLTSAVHNIGTIVGIAGVNFKSGLGANFATAQVTFSGLVITIVTKNAAGAASTTWGDVNITLLGY